MFLCGCVKIEIAELWGRSSEGERWNRTPEVAGSNPAASTIILPSFSPILPPLCTRPLHARKNPKIQGITKVGGFDA